jgi:hypothetical protein
MSEGIKCRTAMLELNLTYDGMAQFLGIPRASVVRMCLNDEDLPPKHYNKVAILLNLHRNYVQAKKPVMQLAEDFLVALHRKGGRLWLDDAINLSGLSGQQLKNIENIEQWLVIVWEYPRERYGQHAYVYLTARGYHQIGVPMSVDALVPSEKSRPVYIKGLDEAQQTLLVAFNNQVEWHLKIVDSIRQIQTMVTLGLTTVGQALELYDAAVGQLSQPTPLRAITQGIEKDEN